MTRTLQNVSKLQTASFGSMFSKAENNATSSQIVAIFARFVPFDVPKVLRRSAFSSIFLQTMSAKWGGPIYPCWLCVASVMGGRTQGARCLSADINRAQRYPTPFYRLYLLQGMFLRGTWPQSPLPSPRSLLKPHADSIFAGYVQ